MPKNSRTRLTMARNTYLLLVTDSRKSATSWFRPERAIIYEKHCAAQIRIIMLADWMALCFMAVSYTHLDVYKRQGSSGRCSAYAKCRQKNCDS